MSRSLLAALLLSSCSEALERRPPADQSEHGDESGDTVAGDQRAPGETGGCVSGDPGVAGDPFVAGDPVVAGDPFVAGDPVVAGDPFVAGDPIAGDPLAGDPFVPGDPLGTGDPAVAGDPKTGDPVAGDPSTTACRADMVPLNDQVCMDRYEASRPDATAGSFGSDTAYATSRYGVLPWFPVDILTARAACANAGKRLCTADEILQECSGAAATTYVYGNDYVADTCNGIDAYCYCDTTCVDVEPCPYPHCRSYSPEGVYGEGCGAYFHVVPTGTFTDCVSDHGAFDLVGNVWELVDLGNDESWFRAGAYNCNNSELLHECDSLYPGASVSAKGFRCCLDL